MKPLALALFILLFISCAGSGNKEAQYPSTNLYQAIEGAACPNETDFRGIGIGYTESEALAQARSNMALEHFSQKLKSNVQISGQNINRVASSNTQTNIDQEATLINSQDAKLHYSVRRGEKIGVVACMSKEDIARIYNQKQIQLQDSLELSMLLTLKATNPKQKSEARMKADALWTKMLLNQELLNSWEIDSDIGKAKDFHDAVEDDYKDYCQTAKLHWNPEQEDSYSGIAFAMLSKNLKMEKSTCSGRGISLVYKNSELKCEQAGIFNCSYQPSLRIASCEGTEHRLLESANMESYHQKEDVALEKLQDKFRNEKFWNQWEQEIKQWSPQCE